MKEARMKKTPRRIAARNDPATYSDTDLLTLAEAAALMWPDGPVTESTLRTMYRAKKLTVVILARKLMTTKAYLREMTENACRKAGT
jgi:hypothetical protein